MLKVLKKRLNPALLVTVLLLTVLALSGMLLAVNSGYKAIALEVPGELGSAVGDPIACTFETQAAQAQNYTGGYAIWKNGKVGDGDRDNILKVVAFKRVVSNGSNGLTVTNFTKTEVDTYDKAYSGGIDRDIGIGDWWDAGGRGGRGAVYDQKFSSTYIKADRYGVDADRPDHGFKLRIKKAYLNLYENGLRDGVTRVAGDFNIGLPIGGIDTWDGVAPKQDYWYGSASSWDNGGRISNAVLAYNFDTDSFWVVHSDIYKKWAEDNNRFLFGAPVSNAELVSELKTSNTNFDATDTFDAIDEETTGITFTEDIDVADTDVVQVFEKAVIKSNGTVIRNLKYDHATRTIGLNPDPYDITPSGVPSEFGNFVGLSAQVETTGYMHQFYNYKNGVVYLRISKDTDHDQSGQVNLGTVNFPGTFTPAVAGDTALTRAEVLALVTDKKDVESDVGRRHDDGAVNAVNNILNAAKKGKTYSNVQDLYKKYYREVIKVEDYILGVSTRGINTWDGNVVQPFAWGQGTTTIDNNQNATFLIYNTRDHKVFRLRDAIGGRFNSVSDIRANLGNVLEDQHEVTLDRPFTVGPKTYDGEVTIQQTTSGTFIVKGNQIDWLVGYAWDEDNNYFKRFPSPAVSSDFGTLVETKRVESISYVGDSIEKVDNVYYINYTRGCVQAISNANGTGYTYNYRPGRNYDFKTLEEVMLPMDMFINESLLSVDASEKAIFGDKTDAQIEQMFIAAYKRYYDQGYFIGSLESNIKGWNNVIGQQFKTGDSVAKPWGDGRANIAFLAYNPQLDGVFLITDGALTAFDSAGNEANALGAPLENPIYYKELEVSIQRFSRISGSGNQATNVFLVTKGVNSYLMDASTCDELGIKGTATKSVTKAFIEWYAKQDTSATHKQDMSYGYISSGDIPYDALGLEEMNAFIKANVEEE